MTNVYKDYNDFCLWGDLLNLPYFGGDCLNMYLFNSAMQYFLRSKEKNDVFLFTNGNI
jgi:hypothetical protein